MDLLEKALNDHFVIFIIRLSANYMSSEKAAPAFRDGLLSA